MERITIEKLKELTSKINYLLNRSINTFKLGQRNGFVYFDFADNSKEALFNNAKNNRELYNSLQAFKEGLYYKIDE